MRLWTYHPASFRVDDPNLRIDYTLGDIWNCDSVKTREGYRRALPRLHQLLDGETQFLWCCTGPRQFVRITESIDLVEWELLVPDAQVLSLYRESLWKSILYEGGDHWAELLVSDLSEAGNKDIGALLRVPIEPEWATRREMEPRYPSRPQTAGRGGTDG